MRFVALFSGFPFLSLFSRATILSLWVREVLYHFNGLVAEDTLQDKRRTVKDFFHGFLNRDKVTE